MLHCSGRSSVMVSESDFITMQYTVWFWMQLPLLATWRPRFSETLREPCWVAGNSGRYHKWMLPIIEVAFSFILYWSCRVRLFCHRFIQCRLFTVRIILQTTVFKTWIQTAGWWTSIFAVNLCGEDEIRFFISHYLANTNRDLIRSNSLLFFKICVSRIIKQSYFDMHLILFTLFF